MTSPALIYLGCRRRIDADLRRERLLIGGLLHAGHVPEWVADALLGGRAIGDRCLRTIYFALRACPFSVSDLRRAARGNYTDGDLLRLARDAVSAAGLSDDVARVRAAYDRRAAINKKWKELNTLMEINV